MKIAVIQSPGVMGDINSNLRYLSETAIKAADLGAQLLITPEMFITGYNLNSFDGLSQSKNGEIAQRIAEISVKSGMHIIYGYCELEHDQLFNSAQLIDKHGDSLINYRKQHLYGVVDNKWFVAGAASHVVELDDIKIGLLICFDVEFPEAVRLLALQGAQLIAVPTSLMHPYGFVAKKMIQVRAYENQTYIAYANRIGTEGELDYCGSSIISGPDGKKICGAELGEALLIGEINTKHIEQVRHEVNYLDNRRPDCYLDLSRRNNKNE